MTPLPALVLTAGRGTRLYPLTLTRAKPAAPVAGIPLVVRILRRLADQGIRDAVLNLHHLPHTVASVVGDGSPAGLRVRYSWEQPHILGSAGGPRRALDLIDADQMLIVNGDTLTDVSLSGLLTDHRARGAAVTLAVIPNPAPDWYGGVLVDAEGCVTGFSRRGEPQPSWHFVGLQVAETTVFASLADGVVTETIAGLYPAMIRAHPGSVRAWRTTGAFLDIGTPADYLRANLALAADEGTRPPFVGHGCSIAASARLVDTIACDEVSVGPDTVLVRCVLADGVRMPAGVHYENHAFAPLNGSALVAGTRVEHGLAVVPIEPLPSASAL